MTYQSGCHKKKRVAERPLLIIAVEYKLPLFVDVPMYKSVHFDMSVESVIYEFLGIPCHNAFDWGEVHWIRNRRSQLHRDVRSIDVTRVKKALALVTDNH